MTLSAIFIAAISLEVAVLLILGLYLLYKWRRSQGRRPKKGHYEMIQLYNRGACFQRLARRSSTFGPEHGMNQIPPVCKESADVCGMVRSSPASCYDNAMSYDRPDLPLSIDIDDDVSKLDQQGLLSIHQAAMQGDLPSVQRYLETDRTDLNKINELGYSPLAVAAAIGHPTVVQYLIDQGADLNLCSTNGLTPLHLASREGHLEVVHLLCQSGAKVDFMSQGYTPLSTASYRGHKKVVNLLIKSKADMNLSGPGSFSPLHMASMKGHLPVVCCLYGAGADVDRVVQGYTALGAAAVNGHANVAAYLIKNNANVALCGNTGLTPLHLAAKQGHLDIVKRLCDSRAIIDQLGVGEQTPVQMALAERHTEVVKFLVQKGANITLEDSVAQMPLYGSEPLATARSESDHHGDARNGIVNKTNKTLVPLPNADSGVPGLVDYVLWHCPDSTQNMEARPSLTDKILALKYIQEIYHVRCCNTAGGLCQSPELHLIHTEVQRVLNSFIEADSQKRRNSLKPTGSFHLNNQIGVFDKLEYCVTFNSQEMDIHQFEDKPMFYQVSLQKNDIDLDIFDDLTFVNELKTFLMKQYGNGHKKSKIKACYPRPLSSGVCVLLEWDCPKRHTHHLQVIITTLIQLEGKCIADICLLPTVLDTPLFANVKEELSSLPAFIVENMSNNIENVTPTWQISFDHTMGLVFKSFDRLSPNVRTCFHLLQFFAELLPMKITYSPEIYDGRQCYESSPVISSFVIYNTLLREVEQHPTTRDWADHHLPDRLISLLNALRTLTYIDFFKATSELSLRLSNLNEHHKETLMALVEADIDEIIRILSKPKRESYFLGSEKHSMLCKASYYSRERKICILTALQTGEVRCSLQSKLRLRFGSASLRQDIGLGDPNELYYYHIPAVKIQCEKLALYTEVLNVVVKKFEVAEREAMQSISEFSS